MPLQDEPTPNGKLGSRTKVVQVLLFDSDLPPFGRQSKKKKSDEKPTQMMTFLF